MKCPPAGDELRTASYHLEELRIALSPDDPRHVMPPIPPGSRRILDVGCGMGQTLMANETSAAVACGVEPDLSAVRLGRSRSQKLQLICGSAERLPVRSSWADVVIARLSLPYTDIPVAVNETYRVLRPGGQFWSVLHPAGMTFRALVSNMAHGEAQALAYQVYVLLNGPACTRLAGSSDFR